MRPGRPRYRRPACLRPPSPPPPQLAAPSAAAIAIAADNSFHRLLTVSPFGANCSRHGVSQNAKGRPSPALLPSRWSPLRRGDGLQLARDSRASAPGSSCRTRSRVSSSSLPIASSVHGSPSNPKRSWDAPLALGKGVQRTPDALAAERLLGLVERVGRLAVGEEVTELAFVVRADRLVQRDRRVAAPSASSMCWSGRPVASASSSFVASRPSSTSSRRAARPSFC